MDADGALLLLREILADPATTPTWVTLVTSALGGLVGGSLTLVGVMLTQRAAKGREDTLWGRERETHVQQQLAESYLEVLRIVEREGQWIEASITNWKTAADEADWGVGPEDRSFGVWERVKMPEPDVTDRAVIAAHLAAFGSDHVRGFYIAWRSTIEKIEIQLRFRRPSGRPSPPG